MFLLWPKLLQFKLKNVREESSAKLNAIQAELKQTKTFQH